MSHAQSVGLLIHGARGRMGARMSALARIDARFEVVGEVDRDDHALAQGLPRHSISAIVDFSSNQGAQQAAQLATEVEALRAERKQVRSRIEKLLGQVDQLSGV